MAIQVLGTEGNGAGWTVRLAVEEGVYRWPDYRVRLRDVPAPPPGWDDAAVRQALAAFALDQVRRHLWEGALPPYGMEVAADGVFTG
ncbi:conserved protein of unknown function [Candidatus Hydrogenisulfobacillus filiaventi]|uniref:Uncharacterized protein n=1 Tax=Candidatus Hydrogenisulfobacillus filiaventi TaxID=2707344 RepID=A0A6F8ZFP8_9FIRM|nr:hypothetical protein [Bacillota bacterium]CAB1128524.1 conserved protein of unknown function [Candidatus Hydrogenisulfobacillus filiaventi]